MRLVQPALAAALAFMFAGDAAAQNAAIIDATKPPAASPLRYRFSHVADGVMRLDHQSGQVVFCKSQAGGKWLCNAVPEEGEVLKAQIQQAENDNSKLVEQLGALQKQLNMPAEERAALTAAMEKVQADSASARSELKGEFAALREEITALKQQLSGNQTGETLKAIEQARTDSAAVNGALKSELTALREEIAALKQQLSGDRTEQTLKAEVAKIRTSNEALAADLAARLAEMRKDIAAIGAQVTAQKELEAQRAAVAKLQTENRALNDRIAALQDETGALQKRIAELEPPRPPAPVPNAGESKAPQMPTKEDLAAARAKIAEAWRRVVEMLNDLSRDLTGKKDDGSVRL